METRVAKIISYIFHPIFMPIYGLLLLFNIKSYFSFELILKARLLLLAFVFVTTVLFPLLIVALMKRQGFIENYQMKNREERRFPYLITAIFYFIAYQILRQMQFPEVYSFYFMGATFLLATVVILNIWWKISIHMVGLGGISGMMCGLAITLSLNIFFLISLTILASGIVGYARLKLETHKSSEIYLGFLMGFCIMLGLYLLV